MNASPDLVPRQHLKYWYVLAHLKRKVRISYILKLVSRISILRRTLLIAKTALDNSWTHYVRRQDCRKPAKQLLAYFNKTRNTNLYNANEVVITPGAKPIIFYPMMAVLDEGDEVIYPNPGFPIYESVINFLKAVPVPLPLREEKEFRFEYSRPRSAHHPKNTDGYSE